MITNIETVIQWLDIEIANSLFRFRYMQLQVATHLYSVLCIIEMLVTILRKNTPAPQLYLNSLNYFHLLLTV